MIIKTFNTVCFYSFIHLAKNKSCPALDCCCLVSSCFDDSFSWQTPVLAVVIWCLTSHKHCNRTDYMLTLSRGIFFKFQFKTCLWLIIFDKLLTINIFFVQNPQCKIKQRNTSVGCLVLEQSNLSKKKQYTHQSWIFSY